MDFYLFSKRVQNILMSFILSCLLFFMEACFYKIYFNLTFIIEDEIILMFFGLQMLILYLVLMKLDFNNVKSAKSAKIVAKKVKYL